MEGMQFFIGKVGRWKETVGPCLRGSAVKKVSAPPTLQTNSNRPRKRRFQRLLFSTALCITHLQNTQKLFPIIMNLPNNIVKTFSQFKNLIFDTSYDLRYNIFYIYSNYEILYHNLIFLKIRSLFGIVIEEGNSQDVCSNFQSVNSK